MKERHWKMKKLLSLTLCLAMLATIIPSTTKTAQAATLKKQFSFNESLTNYINYSVDDAKKQQKSYHSFTIQGGATVFVCPFEWGKNNSWEKIQSVKIISRSKAIKARAGKSGDDKGVLVTVPNKTKNYSVKFRVTMGKIKHTFCVTLKVKKDPLAELTVCSDEEVEDQPKRLKVQQKTTSKIKYSMLLVKKGTKLHFGVDHKCIKTKGAVYLTKGTNVGTASRDYSYDSNATLFTAQNVGTCTLVYKIGSSTTHVVIKVTDGKDIKVNGGRYAGTMDDEEMKTALGEPPLENAPLIPPAIRDDTDYYNKVD